MKILLLFSFPSLYSLLYSRLIFLCRSLLYYRSYKSKIPKLKRTCPLIFKIKCVDSIYRAHFSLCPDPLAVRYPSKPAPSSIRPPGIHTFGSPAICPFLSLNSQSRSGFPEAMEAALYNTNVCRKAASGRLSVCFTPLPGHFFRPALYGSLPPFYSTAYRITTGAAQ